MKKLLELLTEWLSQLFMNNQSENIEVHPVMLEEQL